MMGRYATAALCAICLLWYGWSNVVKAVPDLPKPSDLSWHLNAAQALLRGETPYTDTNYDYPPLAAFLATPLARLSYPQARWVWFIVSHGFLLATAYLVWWHLGSGRLALGCTALVWAFGGAARENLALGQLAPFLALLLAVAYFQRGVAGGFAAGFGFGLKFIPGVLGLPLLIGRKWKSVAGALLGGVIGFVLPWIAIYSFSGPKAPLRADYWMGTPAIMSWSVPSSVLRVLDPATKGPYLPLNWSNGNGANNIRLSARERLISLSVAVSLLLVGAVMVVVLTWQRPDASMPYAMAGLISLGLAASPISWTHYQLLQYPGLALLLHEAFRRKKWAVFAAAAIAGLATYQIPVAVLTAYFHRYGRWTADSPLTLYIWTNVTPAACLLLFGLHLCAAQWQTLSSSFPLPSSNRRPWQTKHLPA